MASTLTTVFVALLILTAATRVWLGRRHVSYIQSHRGQVPAAFNQSISLDEHQKAADYSSAKTQLVITEGLAQAVLLILFTIGGGLQLIDTAWRAAMPDQEM
ncbi:MAG TPA: M48 family peptidase, partial [Methylophilaceae bacterium]|nr:M48 family peptidase [Methylophilaceae bacterium]